MRLFLSLILLLGLSVSLAAPPSPAPSAAPQEAAEARLEHFRAQARGKPSFKLLQRMNKLTRILEPRRASGESVAPDDIDHQYAAYLDVLRARRAEGEGEAALCLAWLDYEPCRQKPCAETVVENIRRAADSGIPLAMDEMAKLHRDGYGLPPSRREAADWFLRAARGYHARQLREATLHSLAQALALVPDHAEALTLRQSLSP